MTFLRLNPLFRLYSPLIACFILLAAFIVPVSVVKAIDLPPDFVEANLLDDLDRATTMAFAPDGRLFIAEQGGDLLVYKEGVLLPDPAISLDVSPGSERGLLGVVFDPSFETNGYIYLYYTVDGTGSSLRNRVSRFTMTGDVIDPQTEFKLLQSEPLSATNHNGGALHFGKDGKLYVAIGDNAVASNSQTLKNMLGKVHRINSDGTIPTNNPFYNRTNGKRRAIWTLGLRNPYTFGIQPVSGRIFINDVGQSSFEEINLGRRGANYGWPGTEGYTNDPRYDSPLYAYNHNNGECSIVGGAFYNPKEPQFPVRYIGDYFFADFCGNWIHVMDVKTGNVTEFATETTPNPVDVRLGPDGALYYLTLDTLNRIDYVGDDPGADLLTNGGFEDITEPGVFLPAGWELKDLTNDKTVCDKTQRPNNKPPQYFADEGECAFRFFGAAQKKARLIQTIDGTSLNVDDQLTLSAVIQANNIPANKGIVRANITYSDQTTDAMVIQAQNGTYGYSGYSTSLTLDKAVESITVIVRYQGASGTMTVDRVRLQVESGGGGLISLPSAPDTSTLRGN